MEGSTRMESDERSNLFRQATEIHRFSTEMYGSKDIFVPAIDYEDKKFSWLEISE